MPFDINDPETKAALKAAVAEAVDAAKAVAEEAASALQANNQKLLGQLREAKKGQEIDPAKHAALEDKVTELTGLLSTTQKDAEKANKAAATQLETLTKQFNAENGFTQKLLVENGLNDALVKAGVTANFLPAVKAMLSGNVKVVAEGDVRKAVVGDKSLGDFVAGWAQTEEGKHFIAAPANTGGNANGGKNVAVTTTIAAGDKKAFGNNLAEIAKGNNSTVKIA